MASDAEIGAMIGKVAYYLIKFGPGVLNTFLGKEIFNPNHAAIAADVSGIVADNFEDIAKFFQGDCIWDKTVKCNYNQSGYCWITVKLATEGRDAKDWQRMDFLTCKYRESQRG